MSEDLSFEQLEEMIREARESSTSTIGERILDIARVEVTHGRLINRFKPGTDEERKALEDEIVYLVKAGSLYAGTRPHPRTKAPIIFYHDMQTRAELRGPQTALYQIGDMKVGDVIHASVPGEYGTLDDLFLHVKNIERMNSAVITMAPAGRKIRIERVS